MKEVAGRSSLEKGGLCPSLVAVSFTNKEVLPASSLSPTWAADVYELCYGGCLGPPLPDPTFLFLSLQGMGSCSCH